MQPKLCTCTLLTADCKQEQKEAEGKQRAALEAANNRISSERERRLNILRRIMQRMMHAKMMSVFEQWRCAAEDSAAAREAMQ